MKITEAASSSTTREAAQRLYEAYTANSDGKAWNGAPCPSWDGLNDAVRSHWCAVAVCAHGLVTATIAAGLAQRGVDVPRCACAGTRSFGGFCVSCGGPVT